MNTLPKPSKTISFKHNIVDASLQARQLWQVLFDYYRNGSGDLKNMDSLLCDLRMIERRIERVYQTGGILAFNWAFHGWWTELVDDYPPATEYIHIEFNYEQRTINFYEHTTQTL